MSAKLWLGLMALVIVTVAVAGWITSTVRWAASRPRRGLGVVAEPAGEKPTQTRHT